MQEEGRRQEPATTHGAPKNTLPGMHENFQHARTTFGHPPRTDLDLRPRPDWTPNQSLGPRRSTPCEMLKKSWVKKFM
eukprot:7560077-Pyramimonas_sp.AAC.1